MWPKDKDGKDLVPEFKEDRILDPNSRLGALLNGAAQGTTAGFSDELYGLIRAIASKKAEDFWDTYREGRDEARGYDKESSDSHPYVHATGEVAGGVAMPLPGMASMKGLSAAEKALAFAKAGTPVGAAFGLGKSKADLTSGDPEQLAYGVLDTLGGASAGAAGAAVAGPVMGAGGEAVADVLRAIAIQRVAPRLAQRAARRNQWFDEVGQPKNDPRRTKEPETNLETTLHNDGKTLDVVNVTPDGVELGRTDFAVGDKTLKPGISVTRMPYQGWNLGKQRYEKAVEATGKKIESHPNSQTNEGQSFRDSAAMAHVRAGASLKDQLRARLLNAEESLAKAPLDIDVPQQMLTPVEGKMAEYFQKLHPDPEEERKKSWMKLMGED